MVFASGVKARYFTLHLSVASQSSSGCVKTSITRRVGHSNSHQARSAARSLSLSHGEIASMWFHNSTHVLIARLNCPFRLGVKPMLDAASICC
jgi:hypothetical protein